MLPCDRTVLVCLSLLGVSFAFAGPLEVPVALQANPHVASSPVPEARRQEIQRAYGQLPLSFEANRGQVDPRVAFFSRGSGYTLFLTPREAVISLRNRQGQQAVIRTRLIGAGRHPDVVGLDALPGTANYFLGADPAQWHTSVPTYRKVNYREVYPGIDLTYYGNQQQLEYDFVVAPGADPKLISMEFQGADDLEIDAQGDVVLHMAGREVREHKPVVYQEIGSARTPIEGRFVRRGKHRAGFQVARYDTSRPLVIDPMLAYSTYLGGSDVDTGNGIAVDSSGNAYITGLTGSGDFPTTSGAFQTTFNGGGSDAFVTKLNPTGTALVYSTFLGGTGNDQGNGIAVDSSGNAYVTGFTQSANFPTTPGAFQTTFNGGIFSHEAFVTKLNPTGELVYSTYLGGTSFGDDQGNGIAVDSSGNAYVTGLVSIPLNDVFVAKLNPTGTVLVYSIFLRGFGNDQGNGIAVDSSGNAYVTGQTGSPNFPTTAGAFQTTFGGGNVHAFVTKFNPSGAVVYSTFLGGSNDDYGNGIAVDSSGNAYVTGETFSNDFPTTPGAFQTTFGGGVTDGFVTKLNATGTALVYSTYLGGNGGDQGNAIAVDSSGNAYVMGFTGSNISGSNNFPTTADAFQTTFGGVEDAFVTKLNPTGTALVYSTFLGGILFDVGNSIAVDSSGNVYVAGHTDSGLTFCCDFPTSTGAFQTTYGGGDEDAFVTKFQFGAPGTPDLAASKSDNVGNTTELGNSWTWKIHVTNQGTGDATFTRFQTILTDNLPISNITYGTPTVSGADITCSITGNDLTCTPNAAILTIPPSGFFDVSFSATPTATGTYNNPRANGICRVNPNNDVVESDAANDTNNNCSDSMMVTEPDLTATKSNNVGGSVVFPNSWTWKITIANGGTGAATFTSGQTILTDNLPNTNISYGPVNVTRADVSCSIASANLTCTANAATVTIAPATSFDVTFAATPANAGTFVNPRASGGCTVDPGNVIIESNENNNSCADTVTVLFGQRYPDSYQIGYISNLPAGDSVLDLTNAGTRGGVDPAGSICANVYVFDPNQQMIACCSCYLTPDHLRTLSAKQDMVSNTLTPAAPTSVVIKVLASDPVSSTQCDPAFPTAGTLEQGLRVWGTTLHQGPSGSYQVTERPFLDATLSETEVTKLTTDCGFIRANGSGYGICNSCRTGAQGAATR